MPSKSPLSSHLNGNYGPRVYGKEMPPGAAKVILHDARPLFKGIEPTVNSGVRLGHVLFARDLLAYRCDVLKEKIDKPSSDSHSRISPNEIHELESRTYDLEDIDHYLSSRCVASQVELLLTANNVHQLPTSKPERESQTVLEQVS